MKRKNNYPNVKNCRLNVNSSILHIFKLIMIQYPLKSILKGNTESFIKKSIMYMTLVLLTCVSCSKQSEFASTLPKPIIYSNIEFKSCISSDSPYLCITKSNATKIVLEFKQCQEQNNLLRELHGN